MSEEKLLMKGNEAIAEAAIRAGCTAYYGYPITPQNELTAYMARHMLARAGSLFKLKVKCQPSIWYMVPVLLVPGP